MSFISVQFGYNQSKFFNINCQIAPLLDSIHDGCYKDMKSFMKKREEFFNKEIANLKKKEATLLKKMEKLDPPKDQQKEEQKQPSTTKGSKREASPQKKPQQMMKTGQEAKAKKKQEEEERKRKEAEEAERIRKEEEERKKKEEEEAAKKAEEEKKAKEKKPPAKGGKVEEKKEEVPVVETEEQKLQREKAEVTAQIEEIKKQVDALNGKLKLLADQMVKINEEEGKQKLIDLCEKTGERKHMKASADSYANGLLRERKAYVLSKISKGPTDDEVIENIVIDGACIRTPEEDIKWEEEQRELEAQAAGNKKGGKGAPPAKKGK